MLAVSLSLPSVAFAEPTTAQLQEARKLFQAGLDREEKGDWSGALALFRRVAEVKANHIVHFHIALCLEKSGHLVESMAEFAIAKTTAEREGGTDADLTIANSKKHVDALRARTPSVHVVVKDATVFIDGAPVANALVSSPIQLDPGEHVISVRADGKKPFETKVTLVDGVTVPVEITPSLEPLPAKKSPPKSAPLVTTTKELPPDRTAAWIATGGAIVAFAGAGVFFALRGSTLSELDGACDGNRAQCDPSKRDLESRGKTYTIVGDVLLGVGAIAAGTAIVLFTTGDRSKVTAGVGGNGLMIAGRF
ncbi:MAG: hypothetical protein ACXVEE_32945 [Polyangiales bacterium]